MSSQYTVGSELKWPMAILALLAVALYTLAANSDVQSPIPLLREKLAVSQKLSNAQQVIRNERIRLHIPITLDDTERTGWIGAALSVLTTEPGSVKAKRSTTNPNFGAAAVQMLSDAGVRKGDAVAIGMSGSFPALNTAVIAATEEIGAYPIVISSVGASQWGANQPGLTWQRMERALRKHGIIAHGSVAVSRGGSSQTEARVLRRLESEARKCHVQVINDDSLTQSITKRIEIYRKEAGSRRLALFVNVGGAAVNVGVPQIVDKPDSVAAQGVMGLMKSQGIPVLDLRGVKQICQRYGLPWDPSPLPRVGDGALFHVMYKSPVVVGICLLLLAGSTWCVITRRIPWAWRSPLELGEPIRPWKE